jgi:hypothetical protein
MRNVKSFKMFKYLSAEELIFIYQMGKVGSTSIEGSLEKTNYIVEHAHSLYEPMTYSMFKKFNSIKFYLPWYIRLKHKITSGIIKRSIIKHKRNLKVVSLVREPISRNISMFFQDLHIPIFDLAVNNDTRLEEFSSSSVFHQLFINSLNQNYGVDWFDLEFFKTFKVNVYDYNFNKDAGYSIINNGNVDIMIIKMEKLSDLEKEVGDFLGLENFKLATNNRGGQKWYGPLYEKFKKEFKPDENFIDNLYTTKYMKHFYTENEIADFKDKWLRKN